jgi:hypothetical protein
MCRPDILLSFYILNRKNQRIQSRQPRHARHSCSFLSSALPLVWAASGVVWKLHPPTRRNGPCCMAYCRVGIEEEVHTLQCECHPC